MSLLLKCTQKDGHENKVSTRMSNGCVCVYVAAVVSNGCVCVYVAAVGWPQHVDGPDAGVRQVPPTPARLVHGL